MFIGLAVAQEPSPSARPLPPNVETFTIETRSEQNKKVPFYLRVPRGYDPARKDRVYRLLFVCPVYNGDGRIVIRGERDYKDLIALADQRDWFVLTATFKQRPGDVRDRKTSYYYPETFSGRAVVEAIEQVAKKYPVDANRILLQGLSGGAQFAHRFALWAPERVTAVAANSSSWFDQPGPGVEGIAWLVTIGESDPSLENTLEFITKLSEAGATPVFRTYLGMVHEGDPRVSRLTVAFLTFHDERTKGDLGKRESLADRMKPRPIVPKEDFPFIGDYQNWRYLPNTAENQEVIPDDVRVYLPSEAIAKLWGRQEDE